MPPLAKDKLQGMRLTGRRTVRGAANATTSTGYLYMDLLGFPIFNPGIWDGKNQTLVTPKSLGLQVPKIYVYKARSRSIPSAARDKGPIFYSDQTQFSRGDPIMEPLPATLQLHNPVILPSFPVISQWPFINLSIHFRIKPPCTQPQVSASRHRRNRSVDSYQRKFAKISLISYL